MRRLLTPLLLALLAAGCAGRGSDARATGPFLRPGPLGPDNGGVPRSPGQWAGSAGGRAASGAPRLPAGLTADHGRRPLPGARLAGLGAYRAAVVPLALGTAMPVLDETVLAAGYFGGPSVSGTVGDALFRESAGAFRLSAQVLPVLVNPDASFDSRAPSLRELEMLIRRALESWGRESDLAAFDNDGPDGIPGSPDDDATLDLVWVVVESPHPMEPFTLPGGFELVSGGRRVRTGPVHVLGAPGGVLPDLRVPLDQTLASLGVGPTERFFPAGYPRTVSSLARTRLGWVPVQAFPGGEEAALPSGSAVLLPLADVSVDGGFWLVEHSGAHVFSSRVALRPDRFYQVTDSVTWQEGAEQVLPLSFHLGERGPTVLVRWEAGTGDPRIYAGNAYPAAPAHAQAQTARSAVRPAAATAPESYRWLRLGSDSVRVAISGPPLVVP
jgi:hypothetical protein